MTPLLGVFAEKDNFGEFHGVGTFLQLGYLGVNVLRQNLGEDFIEAKLSTYGLGGLVRVACDQGGFHLSCFRT